MIVQIEFVEWLTRQVDDDAEDDVRAYAQTCLVVPLNTATAVAAAETCARFRLPTSDAIVYATARAHDLDILTCDRHFDGLPGVVYVAKSG